MLEHVDSPTKGILDNCVLFGEFIFRKYLSTYSLYGGLEVNDKFEDYRTRYRNALPEM